VTSAPGTRWATFDCYGTLVDWESGIRVQLERLFGEREGDRLLARYHELEPAVQRDAPALSYREVLSRVLERVAEEEGVDLGPDERDSLARSLPGWPVFDDVAGGLTAARERGWRLAILSNTDRDLIDASMRSIGVPFDRSIVASEIGSYKPAHEHWHAFFEQTGAERKLHVHVAASIFHDIAPAHELGLRSVWINRLAEDPDPRATLELPDLASVAAALDGLVPSPLS
jgi:2-haloacid dehalogenase